MARRRLSADGRYIGYVWRENSLELYDHHALDRITRTWARFFWITMPRRGRSTIVDVRAVHELNWLTIGPFWPVRVCITNDDNDDDDIDVAEEDSAKHDDDRHQLGAVRDQRSHDAAGCRRPPRRLNAWLLKAPAKPSKIVANSGGNDYDDGDDNDDDSEINRAPSAASCADQLPAPTTAISPGLQQAKPQHTESFSRQQQQQPQRSQQPQQLQQPEGHSQRQLEGEASTVATPHVSEVGAHEANREREPASRTDAHRTATAERRTIENASWRESRPSSNEAEPPARYRLPESEQHAGGGEHGSRLIANTETTTSPPTVHRSELAPLIAAASTEAALTAASAAVAAASEPTAAAVIDNSRRIHVCREHEIVLTDNLDTDFGPARPTIQPTQRPDRAVSAACRLPVRLSADAGDAVRTQTAVDNCASAGDHNRAATLTTSTVTASSCTTAVASDSGAGVGDTSATPRYVALTTTTGNSVLSADEAARAEGGTTVSGSSVEKLVAAKASRRDDSGSLSVDNSSIATAPPSGTMLSALTGRNYEMRAGTAMMSPTSVTIEHHLHHLSRDTTSGGGSTQNSSGHSTGGSSNSISNSSSSSSNRLPPDGREFPSLYDEVDASSNKHSHSDEALFSSALGIAKERCSSASVCSAATAASGWKDVFLRSNGSTTATAGNGPHKQPQQLSVDDSGVFCSSALSTSSTDSSSSEIPSPGATSNFSGSGKSPSPAFSGSSVGEHQVASIILANQYQSPINGDRRGSMSSVYSKYREASQKRYCGLLMSMLEPSSEPKPKLKGLVLSKSVPTVATTAGGSKQLPLIVSSNTTAVMQSQLQEPPQQSQFSHHMLDEDFGLGLRGSSTQSSVRGPNHEPLGEKKSSSSMFGSAASPSFRKNLTFTDNYEWDTPSRPAPPLPDTNTTEQGHSVSQPTNGELIERYLSSYSTTSRPARESPSPNDDDYGADRAIKNGRSGSLANVTNAAVKEAEFFLHAPIGETRSKWQSLDFQSASLAPPCPVSAPPTGPPPIPPRPSSRQNDIIIRSNVAVANTLKPAKSEASLHHLQHDSSASDDCGGVATESVSGPKNFRALAAKWEQRSAHDLAPPIPARRLSDARAVCGGTQALTGCGVPPKPASRVSGTNNAIVASASTSSSSLLLHAGYHGHYNNHLHHHHYQPQVQPHHQQQQQQLMSATVVSYAASPSAGYGFDDEDDTDVHVNSDDIDVREHDVDHDDAIPSMTPPSCPPPATPVLVSPAASPVSVVGGCSVTHLPSPLSGSAASAAVSSMINASLQSTTASSSSSTTSSSSSIMTLSNGAATSCGGVITPHVVAAVGTSCSSSSSSPIVMTSSGTGVTTAICNGSGQIGSSVGVQPSSHNIAALPVRPAPRGTSEHKKTFEEIQQQQQQQRTLRIAEHRRFSSIDSNDSGNSSTSNREQYSSLTSLASTTSSSMLISAQDLQHLIDDANQTLAEEDGVSRTGGDVYVVMLYKDSPTSGAGITLAGGSDYESKEITVHKVIAGSAADRDGRIRRGDRVLSINGRALRGATHREALEILKSPRPELVLVLTRDPQQQLLTQPLSQIALGAGSCGSSSSSSSSHGGSRPSTSTATRLSLSRASSASSVLDVIDEPGSDGPLPTFEGSTVVVLEKDKVGLGFTLQGGKDSPLGNRPLTINRIFSCGAAERDGRLQPGDELLAINNTVTTNMTRTEAWNYLKKLPEGRISFTIRHQNQQLAPLQL